MVSAGYFETFRIPVLRGRTFTERDDSGPPVVIINQALAKQFWPNSDPVLADLMIDRAWRGARRSKTNSPRQIIGVASNVRDGGLNRDPRPNHVRASGADQRRRKNALGLADRTMGLGDADAASRRNPSLSSAIQNESREASRGLPVGATSAPWKKRSRARTAAENFNMLVLTIFGCAALLLAAIGIYGLMAYSVAQQTQEIGIRLALGAGSSSVRNMVVLQGVRLALIGVVIGLAAAFGLTRLIASLLYGVKAWDPMVFSSVPLVLMGVAVIAVWLPALRASRVDPIQALRHE